MSAFAHNTTKAYNTTKIKATALALSAVLALTGCSTLKNLTNKSDITLKAQATDSEYYARANDAINKGHFSQAALELNNLRTFYPTSRYAEQALLDLIYVYHHAKDYEAVITAANQFTNNYPNSRHLDYALYAKAITHMRGSPKTSDFFRLNQSERDTSYLRLAFADLQNLLTRFANSPYAPDAALRMTDIYNQFAHHELQAARWYIKKQAYVAAINRAKWVFNYYPQSQSVPEAIAILAYANEQLGLVSTSDDYKTLLKINYPQYLNGDKVILPIKEKSLSQKTLSMLTLGRLGNNNTLNYQNNASYSGSTYSQIIKEAAQLQLPINKHTPFNNTNQSQSPNNTLQLGLGLPNHEQEAGNPNSVEQIASEAIDNSSP